MLPPRQQGVPSPRRLRCGSYWGGYCGRPGAGAPHAAFECCADAKPTCRRPYGSPQEAVPDQIQEAIYHQLVQLNETMAGRYDIERAEVGFLAFALRFCRANS